MSDLILPSIVTAMAHKNLREAAAALRDKLTATNFDRRKARLALDPLAVVRKSRVEYDMLALLEAGQKVLAGHTPAPMPVGLDINGVGKFAILGSSGFAWPDYAAHFTADPVGRSGAMRRGSFDPNHSVVSVGSTQFALRVGELARTKTTNKKETKQIDAFVGGMLSAIAHDVIVGPVARGVRADVHLNRHSRLAIPGMNQATSQAMQTLFGGSRGAGTWQSWWPPEHEVPGELYEGYVEAANEVYGFLDGATPPGLPSFLADFEPPPELAKDRVRAGVSFLTQDLVTSSWGTGTWYALFLPAILAPSTALLIGRYAHPASGFFAENPESTALGGIQIYSIAAGLASLTPFIFSMHMWTQVPEHGRVFVSALVTGIVRLVSTVLVPSFAADDADGGAWTFFVLQTLTDLYSLISGFVDLGLGHSADAFLELFNSMPFVFGLTAVGLAALMEATPQRDEVDFWVPWAFFTFFLGVVGLAPAAALAGGDGVSGLFKPGSSPKLPVIAALESGGAGRISATGAVFDDSTLVPTSNDAAATGLTLLSSARHVGDANVVIKVWWEGSDDLTIEHDNHRVVFRESDGTEHEVVFGPHQAEPVAVATLLEAKLAGVKTAVVDEAVAAPLAWPNALHDPGDDEPSLAEHDEHATKVQPVGTTEDDAYELRAAPRSVVATRIGSGPSAAAGAGAPDSGPIPVAPASSEVDQSALGLAAELASLLVAGAVPSLIGAKNSSVPPPNDTLGPVHQVFRTWNLDERRLNEWRAIVTGGATVEKMNPANHDALMRPLDAAASPYANNAPQGDDLLNDMGWIPTWRAWLRMASDVTSDAMATTAERYTPLVARRDGRLVAPTNNELSDAMRFLFDLR